MYLFIYFMSIALKIEIIVLWGFKTIFRQLNNFHTSTDVRMYCIQIKNAK